MWSNSELLFTKESCVFFSNSRTELTLLVSLSKLERFTCSKSLWRLHSLQMNQWSQITVVVQMVCSVKQCNATEELAENDFVVQLTVKEDRAAAKKSNRRYSVCVLDACWCLRGSFKTENTWKSWPVLFGLPWKTTSYYCPQSLIILFNIDNLSKEWI